MSSHPNEYRVYPDKDQMSSGYLSPCDAEDEPLEDGEIDEYLIPDTDILLNDEEFSINFDSSQKELLNFYDDNSADARAQ